MADTNDKGNFVAYMNRNKHAGDNKPSFEGRIAIPGTETEHRMALWSHEYTDPKTGEQKIAFNGRTHLNAYTDAPRDQIASIAKAADSGTILQGSLEIARGQIVMFENNAKNEPSKTGNERPDYYGFYNPGDNTPLVRISAWARKDRYQHAMLSGATSYPLPGKTEAQQQDAENDLQGLVESGAVTEGLKGKGSKSKSEDASRS